MRSLGVLLAAGASRRFGPEEKLLAAYRGGALVRAAALALLGAGCDEVLAIVSSEDVAAALPAGAEICRIAPGQEMAASFHAAIDQAVARQASRLLICLGDMPNVSPALLRQLAARDRSCACRSGNIRTPPLLLAEADYAAARASAEGDRGARQFLATLPPDTLMAVDPGEMLDIDQPADLPLVPL